MQIANFWRFFGSCVFHKPRAAHFRPAFYICSRATPCEFTVDDLTATNWLCDELSVSWVGPVTNWLASAKVCDIEQRVPPIFSRAVIILCIYHILLCRVFLCAFYVTCVCVYTWVFSGVTNTYSIVCRCFLKYRLHTASGRKSLKLWVLSVVTLTLDLWQWPCNSSERLIRHLVCEFTTNPLSG